jgi:hypothetical protein
MDDRERDEPGQAPPADTTDGEDDLRTSPGAVTQEAQDAAEQELEYPADETDEG